MGDADAVFERAVTDRIPVTAAHVRCRFRWMDPDVALSCAHLAAVAVIRERCRPAEVPGRMLLYAGRYAGQEAERSRRQNRDFARTCPLTRPEAFADPGSPCPVVAAAQEEAVSAVRAAVGRVRLRFRPLAERLAAGETVAAAAQGLGVHRKTAQTWKAAAFADLREELAEYGG